MARDDVDLVVEVIGGIEPARTLHPVGAAVRQERRHRQQGAARRGRRHAARRGREGGADLYYEASVAGAIPLLRPLRESLAGDRSRRVMGIVNGTTNFILTRMDETGAGFAEALDEATALGYAEADPTADVEGFDAAAKAAILAGLAFHTRVDRRRRAPRGHHRRSPPPTSRAPSAMGCVVKLLAIAEQRRRRASACACTRR